MRIALIGLFAVVGLGILWAVFGGSARAQPAFKKYFDKEYFGEDSEMRKAYEVSSCNFCHIAGPAKPLNEYGKALGKLLNKKDAENLTFKVRNEKPELYEETEKKVRKALETVERQRSDPTNKRSPTFGHLLREGRLPKSPDPGK